MLDNFYNALVRDGRLIRQIIGGPSLCESLEKHIGRPLRNFRRRDDLSSLGRSHQMVVRMYLSKAAWHEYRGRIIVELQ